MAHQVKALATHPMKGILPLKSYAGRKAPIPHMHHGTCMLPHRKLVTVENWKEIAILLVVRRNYRPFPRHHVPEPNSPPSCCGFSQIYVSDFTQNMLSDQYQPHGIITSLSSHPLPHPSCLIVTLICSLSLCGGPFHISELLIY